MPGPRLTGLEFYWFGQGQALATRYQHDDATNFDDAAAVLVGSVSELIQRLRDIDLGAGLSAGQDQLPDRVFIALFRRQVPDVLVHPVRRQGSDDPLLPP